MKRFVLPVVLLWLNKCQNVKLTIGYCLPEFKRKSTRSNYGISRFQDYGFASIQALRGIVARTNREGLFKKN